MYDTVLPVTTDHNPIVIEGQIETQMILFNAGPAAVEAQVWQNWEGKKDGTYSDASNEPNLRLELRAGNQKIVSGSFIRIKIKQFESNVLNQQFAAIGLRVLL